jgi:hypothetical protein
MQRTAPLPTYKMVPNNGASTAPPIAVNGSLAPAALFGLDPAAVAARRTRMVRGVAVAVGVVVVLAIGGSLLRDRSGNAATPAAIKQTTAGLRASSPQDGIRLVVDGRERGLLPQDVRDLSPGEHSVVFDGADRYASQKSTITLAANEVRELGPVNLKVMRGTATFDVRSPGTSLALVASDERRGLTDWSHPIDVDNSKSWMLEATRSGYKTVRFPVMFETQATKTFVVSVDDPSDNNAAPTPAPVAAAAAAPAAQPAAFAGDDATTTASSKRTHHLGTVAARTTTRGPSAQALLGDQAGDVAPAPATAAAGGTCTLNINSIPPSRIALDGRPMGLTPKIGVSVSSGTHTVMFVGETTKKTQTTTCRPGEQKTVAIRLPE